MMACLAGERVRGEGSDSDEHMGCGSHECDVSIHKEEDLLSEISLSDSILYIL